MSINTTIGYNDYWYERSGVSVSLLRWPAVSQHGGGRFFPTGRVATIPGIDVSSNNQSGPNTIDWPTAAKYLTSLDPEAFVIVKVSEGTNYVNEYLTPQRQGIHAAGIRTVGLYHFGRPFENSGHAEAEYFLNAIGADGGVLKGEFYALDLEDDLVPTADLLAYAIDFLATVERSSGLRPLLYTRLEYMSRHNLLDPALAHYPLWLASYSSYPPIAPLAPPGFTLVIQQYASDGLIPGIPTRVDLDYCWETIDQLHQYCWGFQPDPFGNQPVLPPADLDPSWDLPTSIKHIYALLKQGPSQLLLARADLAAVLIRFWGLQG